jgi:hypothetical protein
MLDVISEVAAAARPAGMIAKTSRRVAVALTMSIGVGRLRKASAPKAPFVQADPRLVAKRLSEHDCAVTMATGMKRNVSLTIISLLTILLSSFHLADDVVHGFEPGGPSNYSGVLIVAIYLFATLMLAERRWAHVIVLIGSIGGAAVPYLHMTGSGLVGPRVASSSNVFFWVWTLLALGVTASVTAVLSARGLWSLRRGQGR